jgi:hypothetical protein
LLHAFAQTGCSYAAAQKNPLRTETGRRGRGVRCSETIFKASAASAAAAPFLDFFAPPPPPPPPPQPRWPLRGTALAARRCARGWCAFLEFLVSSSRPSASAATFAARAFRHAPRGRDLRASVMSSRASISAAGNSATAGDMSRFQRIISDRLSRAASITTTTTGAQCCPIAVSTTVIFCSNLLPLLLLRQLVQLLDCQLVQQAVLLGVLLRRERHLQPARTRCG